VTAEEYKVKQASVSKHHTLVVYSGHGIKVPSIIGQTII
jgi:hypothetical protein